MYFSDFLSTDLTARGIAENWYQWLGPERRFAGASIDSRRLTPGQLFVAMVGVHVDGHEFIVPLLKTAHSVFMVNRSWADTHLTDLRERYPGASFMVVEDTREALSYLALAWRATLSFDWVAVTGSCGKTTVKEMLAHVLKEVGNPIATFGNQNNELGVPLTLLRATLDHDYGVAELGANHLNEIATTVDWVQPKVALLNNVNPAHLEGFGSLATVAAAKSEIFSTLGAADYAVLNRDDAFYPTFLQVLKDQRADQNDDQGMPTLVTFGEHAEANYRLLDYQARQQQIKVAMAGQTHSFSLPLLGKHNALNALACLSVLGCLGIELSIAMKSLSHIKPVKGRLNPIAVCENLAVIDDVYNANPGSVSEAISVLAQFEGLKILVLGDMLELGEVAVSEHQGIGEQAAAQDIHHLLTFGDLMQFATDAFQQRVEQAAESQTQSATHAETIEDLLEALVELIEVNLKNSDQVNPGNRKKITVLIKGSRSMKMERIYESILTRYQDKR